MTEQMIEISLAEYKSLLKSEEKLECLECAGVDNWCGYGDALDMMEDEE